MSALVAPPKSSAMILRLSRAVESSDDMRIGAFEPGSGINSAVAAADHLRRMVGIALTTMGSLGVTGVGVGLDRALPRQEDDSLPIALLLIKDRQTVSIPITWTELTVTFGTSQINPEPVIVALGSRNAGERLSAYVADVVTVFFASFDKLTKAQMRADFIEMQGT